uniref:Uncharacterized protein n=1 Tax=Mustela putorius furo TaxID=9669 RepID=M3XR97_MUSPF
MVGASPLQLSRGGPVCVPNCAQWRRQSHSSPEGAWVLSSCVKLAPSSIFPADTYGGNVSKTWPPDPPADSRLTPCCPPRSVLTPPQSPLLTPVCRAPRRKGRGFLARRRTSFFSDLRGGEHLCSGVPTLLMI